MLLICAADLKPDLVKASAFVHGAGCSSLELPCPAAKWALLVIASSGQPFVDALQVEGVVALPPNHSAVVSWKLCIRWTAVERSSADATDIIACK